MYNAYIQVCVEFAKDFPEKSDQTGTDSANSASVNKQPPLTRPAPLNAVVTVEMPAETKQRRVTHLDTHYRQLSNWMRTAGPDKLAEKEHRYEKYLQEEQQYYLDYPPTPTVRPAQPQAGAGAIDSNAW